MHTHLLIKKLKTNEKIFSSNRETFGRPWKEGTPREEERESAGGRIQTASPSIFAPVKNQCGSLNSERMSERRQIRPRGVHSTHPSMFLSRYSDKYLWRAEESSSPSRGRGCTSVSVHISRYARRIWRVVGHQRDQCPSVIMFEYIISIRSSSSLATCSFFYNFLKRFFNDSLRTLNSDIIVLKFIRDMQRINLISVCRRNSLTIL